MPIWTTEMWQSAAIGCVVGIIVTYLVLRFTKGSLKKQTQRENELKQAKNTLNIQNERLEKYFAESAALFKALANDHQKLYRHYVESSAQLLGDKTAQALFIEEQLSAPQETASAPHDYSQGASGLLKAER